MPEWRQELSRRLQVIKQKREADSGRQDQDGAVPGATEKPERSAVEGSPSSPPSAPPGRQSPGSPGRAETLPDPQSHAHQDPVAETGPAGVPAMRNPKEEGDRTAEDIRSLIDKLVRKQDHPVENPQPEGVPAPTFHDLAIGADPLSDKLVLLTRTFSGLVDMVIVVLLAAAMIFVVDVIEGIVVFDGTSMIYYLALLVATFLIYSVFFLATANQTIGMMITDLRIVGPGSGRPDLRQIFVRCSSYLVSLFGAGIGLFWGVFDRESRCLHDRISRTRVIRLFPH
ncbi:MAG: hypothetical protein FJW35_08035 [Acidobacteria bacterium]|nr:hypothetical protein [Acidobacteriota bacterium]